MERTLRTELRRIIGVCLTLSVTGAGTKAGLGGHRAEKADHVHRRIQGQTRVKSRKGNG